MPRRLIRAPSHSRSRSLGWLAVAWLEYFSVHGPGDVQGEHVVHGDEYTAFLVDCYALESAGRRLYDSAFLSRPKGCDKSGLGARLSLFEALGPCRFVGWAEGGEVYKDPWGLGFEYVYTAGEPRGRPVKVPFIRCMATEEGQSGNTYDSIYYNLSDPAAPLSAVPGLNAGLTRVLLPGGGEITPSTASSAAKDGGKETFVVFDETHLYTTPELRAMYATVSRNMRKRKRIAETWYLETTTMFAKGAKSVAESTFDQADKVEAGKVKRQRVLYDHRWGECEDLSDEPALRKGLIEAYGDALAWNDLDGLVDGFHDVRSEVADSRRYFLNAPTDTTDAWIASAEWSARVNAAKIVADHDVITLGFDGSRRRARGVTDATALIGCRVSDGHVFEIAVWEQPEGPLGADWQVPTNEVDAAVRMAFSRWSVVGFYADPEKWETFVAAWEARYASKLKVKASRDHPIEWWMTGNGKRTVAALRGFLDAVVDGEMTHDGSFTLTRHVLAAHRRSTPTGIQIAKASPESPRKIDAAVAAVLAWEARVAALAAGLGRSTNRSVRRIR